MLVLALLCSLSLSHHECTRDTALDVLVLGTADNAMQCAIGGQMTLGQLAIKADDGYRWVINCQGTTIANGNVG